MRIDGSSFGAASAPVSAGSGGGGGKRARIERQIKVLEEKKQRLLEKIAGQSASSEPKRAGAALSESTVKLNMDAVSANTAQAVASIADAASGAASASTSASVAAVAAAPTTVRIQAPAPRAPAPTDEIDMASDDPDTVMKLIAAIDGQILALRSQLAAEDSLAVLSDAVLPEAAAEASVSEAAQRTTEADGAIQLVNEHGDKATISAEAQALAATLPN